MRSKSPKADFRFKQFAINQDRCAMKVGVEAVAFGSWCDAQAAVDVLDVGTGTGILPLMIAQRNPALKVVGVEVDDEACIQAKENFEMSPWASRLSIVHGDFLNQNFGRQFDLVISNPPFFKAGLQGASEKRNLARFESNLPLSQLIARIRSMLKPKGKCCFLLPAERTDELLQTARSHALFPEKMTTLQSTVNKAPSRILAQFGQDAQEHCKHENLLIYAGKNTYTPEFKKLTEDFYLNV